MKRIALLLPLILWTAVMQAQMTGSFEQSINFTEPDYTFTRTLYYYVPTDYDSNQSYKLVIGFRGGPHSNAGQFRDQLTFLSDSLDAIIVCPENEAHFWNQEGLTKQLFQYSVDTTLKMYNIDTNFIYLTGLSYGGRHAVIVSMDTENGDIPALRGVIPFAPGSDSHLEPDYADVDDFAPACICIGLNDASNFITVANTLQNDITTSGGTSLLNEIPGVGHTVAFPTYPQEMMECIHFIESQYAVSSIEENIIISDSQIDVYPNPSTSLLEISVKGNLDFKEVYLVNDAGQVVLVADPVIRKVDVSDLPNGTYSLILVTKDNTVSRRISVVH